MEALKSDAANDEQDSMTYRQPPHNLEAEQALLGSILVNNEAAQKVQGFLLPEHFYEPVHGRIYSAVLKLMDKNQIADPVKLKPYFENDEALKDVGGARYLVRLAASAATIINAEDYGRTIYDLALRRALIQIGETMVNDAYDAPVDAEASEQISDAEKQLFDLAELGQAESGAQPFSRALRTAVENIENAYKDPDSLSGIDTGLTRLNEKIGGLHNSDLVILAGRPAMGKTALATNIAFNAAKRYAQDKREGIPHERSKGAVVCFFSLEMSADQLASRILSDVANRNYNGPEPIQSHKMRQGHLKEDQFEAIARAAIELEDTPLFIDDTPALTIAALRNRARRSSASTTWALSWSITFSFFVGLAKVPRAKVVCRKFRKLPVVSKVWRKNFMFRLSPFHSLAVRWSSVRTSAQCCLTFVNPAPSSRTRIW